METFKKYVTCIIAFFIPFICVILSQFYSITSPVLFTKNNKLCGMRKKKIFVDMAASAYHVMPKEVENWIFK